MTKKPAWRVELRTYIASVSGEGFRPGRHDCALFVAGAIEAMTGTDYAKGYRGYRTLKAGAAKLQKSGYADHVAYAAAMLPEVPVLMAKIGDVAVIDSDGADVLGIVQGHSIYALGLTGMAIVPLVAAKRAFSV